jgi:ABC-2 type transport system permease protein
VRRLRTIRLVAAREIAERARTKGFWGSLLLTVGLILAAVVVPAVVFADDDTLDVGVIEPIPDGLVPAMATAGTTFSAPVEVIGYRDEAAARAAVEAGTLDGALVLPADATAAPELIVKSTADPRLQAVVAASVASVRLASLVSEHGIPPAAIAALATPATVTSLEQQEPVDQSAFLVANVGVVLLFVSIFSFGYWVLSGVVEEKQSRVVEVVLATVRPRELLIGKVLGIGLLGLLQLVIMVGVGVLAARLTGAFELPDTTIPMVGATLAWYILGYALYSTAFGVLGALASRMEDASNVTAPISLVATGGYLVALFVVVDDPDGLAATLCTFFPPFAPMVVPFRVAYQAISPLEFGLAVMTSLAAVWAMLVVGGRVYRGAVLRIGGQVKLRDAWRAGTE